MFALEALSLAGETYNNSASIRKACAFLVDHQMDDGGWGETYLVSSLWNVRWLHTLIANRTVSHAQRMNIRSMTSHRSSRLHGPSWD